jgi:hypothetical protein
MQADVQHPTASMIWADIVFIIIVAEEGLLGRFARLPIRRNGYPKLDYGFKLIGSV